MIFNIVYWFFAVFFLIVGFVLLVLSVIILRVYRDSHRVLHLQLGLLGVPLSVFFLLGVIHAIIGKV